MVKELEKETKKLSELKVKSVVSFPHLQSTLDQMLPCIWERPRLGSVRECCHAEIVEALLGMKGVYAAVTPSLCKICPFRQTHPEGSLLTTPQIIERIEKME